MQMLEDNQVTMQTCLASRFVHGIRSRVEEWDRKLQVMWEVIDEWVNCLGIAFCFPLTMRPWSGATFSLEAMTTKGGHVSIPELVRSRGCISSSSSRPMTSNDNYPRC